LRAYNNTVDDDWYAMRWREGIALVDEALEYARRTGERTWELSFIMGSIGGLDFLGRWDEALERRAAAEPYATTEFTRGLLLWVALIHLRRGEVAAARELLDRHSDIGRSGNPEFSAGYAAVEGSVLAAEGRYADAFAAALRASPDENTSLAWWLSFTAAEIALALPDDEQARELYDRIDTAVRGKRLHVVDAQLARLRARLFEEDALTALATAERIFRDLEAVYYVAVAQAERAEHLLAAGRDEEVAELLRDSRETLARLRAKPWLERVDAVLGRQQAVA
jgi:hypothetical protein